VQRQLDTMDLTHITTDLYTLLCSVPPANPEHNVKVFHVENNHKPLSCTEPQPATITAMVYRWVTALYQRSVLVSIVKYILLRPLITKFTIPQITQEKKGGIFSVVLQRLNELIFESVLLSFNGSNYDNILVINGLIFIQTLLHEKIKIFKKSSAISTVILTIKKNVISHTALNRNQSLKRVRKRFPMNLYFKDLRNLVAANLTLDKLARLFNIETSKLVFPYEAATSICMLKKTTSLHAESDLFWRNTFSGRTVPLESRQHAQTVYNLKQCADLYTFAIHYLQLDCIVLHQIVLKLYSTYRTKDHINIYIRRNYSQSNLSFQQLFIVEPSRRITHPLAPLKINTCLYNYIFKQAVTGGLCTSFVHGTINKDVIINELFNLLDRPNLCPRTWPNIHLLPQWKQAFNENPTGILTIDIRSLYPSASVKDLPMGQPLFYNRFTKEDHDRLYTKDTHFLRNIHINTYCTHVRQSDTASTDIVRLISEPPRFFNEYNALSYYFSTLPPDIEILRFQSQFTALGQMRFGAYPLDGFLSYRDKAGVQHIDLIQYQSTFRHGHRESCSILNGEADKGKVNHTNAVRLGLNQLINQVKTMWQAPHLHINIQEIFDCDFHNHTIPSAATFPMLPYYQKQYSYTTFLNKIYTNQLAGFLVVRNLEIAQHQQTPMMGFCINKMEYGQTELSPYTQNLLTHFATAQRVVATHKVKGYLVLSTAYFNFLRQVFGFEHPPDILHALIFQHTDYLRVSIEKKLLTRQTLKQQIKTETNPILKQNYEIQAELIKLCLNSCYGFTLCNVDSKKFKMYENRWHIPRSFQYVETCVQLAPKIFLIQKKKKIQEPFSTLLGHVGCTILFHSKRILLKRMLFVLQYLDPRLAQLLYMDTDSSHLLVKHSYLPDNVHPLLRDRFLQLYPKHFEGGGKMAGIWVEEAFYTIGEYLGEKCYRLYNSQPDLPYVTHMKGLNTHFQQLYHTKNINPNQLPYLSYNNFHKTPDFLILKIHSSKNLFSNYVPVKRYFISPTGSLPLRL